MREIKVFVVMKGEYSDKHIAAIFSTEDKMKAFLNVAEEDEYNQEYWSAGEVLLDELITDDSLIPYMVRIDHGVDDFNVKTPNTTKDAKANIVEFGDWLSDVIIYCMAKDATHATKIARERYSQMKALNWFDIYKNKRIEYYTQKEVEFNCDCYYGYDEENSCSCSITHSEDTKLYFERNNICGYYDPIEIENKKCESDYLKNLNPNL